MRSAPLFVALAVAGAVAACGGGGGASQSTTPSNTSGTTDTAGSAKEPGDARVVQRTQSGGVIELIGDRSDSMVRAHAEMDAHCGPGNVTITQEGEEVLDGDTPADGGASVPTTSWRVHYQCGDSVPPGAP